MWRAKCRHHQVKEAAVPKRRTEDVPTVEQEPQVATAEPARENSDAAVEREGATQIKADGDHGTSEQKGSKKGGADPWGVGEKVGRFISKLGKLAGEANMGHSTTSTTAAGGSTSQDVGGNDVDGTSLARNDTAGNSVGENDIAKSDLDGKNVDGST